MHLAAKTFGSERTQSRGNRSARNQPAALAAKQRDDRRTDCFPSPARRAAGPLIRTSHFAAALGFLALTLGCGSRIAYSPPLQPVMDESVTLQASFDDVWKGVIQTFFEKNIPVRTLEKVSGILESDELHGEIGRDCNCGTYLGLPVGGYAGAYGGDAYYRFRVLVEQRGERETRLVLRSSCRAKVESVEGDLVCRLLAARESEVRDAIADRVRRTVGSSDASRSQP